MNYVIVITEDKSISSSIRVILKENFIVEDVPPSEVSKVLSLRKPNLIFLDGEFADFNPIDILERLLTIDPYFTIICLFPSFNRIAKEAIEKGAFAVIEKPFDVEKLLILVKRGIERDFILRENQNLKKSKEVEKEKIDRESKENGLFENFIQIIVDNFSNFQKFCEELLKVLKKHFYLNSSVLILQKDNIFVPVSSIGLEGKILKEIRMDLNDDFVQYFIKKQKILHISDECPIGIKNFLQILNGEIVFPLKTVRGKLIGFLIVGSKIRGEFDFGEICQLNTLCDYLTMMVENIALYNEISFQKEFQDKIFENVPSGIIGVDGSGKIIIFNKSAEKILDIKREEVIRKDVEVVGSQIADYLRKTLKFKKSVSREEFVYIPKNIILGISTSYIGKEEKVEAAVAVFQDLTALKELERRRKEMEKTKYWNVLSYRLSHELKNPLVAIKTFSQMLPEKYDDEEFRNSFSKIIQEEVNKLNGIVEKINRLAESGSESVNFVKFDLSQFLNNLKRKYEKKFKEKKAKFIFSEGNIKEIKADPLKLEEALGYIFDFIFEDLKEEGSLKFSSVLKGENVIIEFIENGGKIQFLNGKDIFVPFIDKLKVNISIGLVLAKRIIELHGGKIEFECNESVKIFKIKIPLKK